jgi:hypothetical protein
MGYEMRRGSFELCLRRVNFIVRYPVHITKQLIAHVLYRRLKKLSIQTLIHMLVFRHDFSLFNRTERPTVSAPLPLVEIQPQLLEVTWRHLNTRRRIRLLHRRRSMCRPNLYFRILYTTRPSILLLQSHRQTDLLPLIRSIRNRPHMEQLHPLRLVRVSMRLTVLLQVIGILTMSP